MNIDDVKEDELIIEGDLFEAIFQRQHELMVKYHSIEEKNGLLQTPEVPVNIDSALGQARLKDFAWRVTEELGEAMNCLKNKPWKVTQMETDRKHYLEELADAFHFFIELCILSGLDARGLTGLYFKKSTVNKFRQRSNY
jgi:hypothetical protein